MKLRILSDLHFEFHKDGGKEFISNQSDANYDALVLAGDISPAKNIFNIFSLFKNVTQDRPIIFVPGNHEYYYSSPKELNSILKACQKENKNLFILNNSCQDINGIKFAGTTLWFKSFEHDPDQDLMNDFQLIKEFKSWIPQQYECSIDFLSSLTASDVVITHHLPTTKSIHPRFGNSILNKYFVNNVSSLLKDINAKLWVHGHTHSSCDYLEHNTRIICNPFGYMNFDINASFQEKLTIEV